jgi:hypothetical protein
MAAGTVPQDFVSTEMPKGASSSDATTASRRVIGPWNAVRKERK